jgi:hypothetical protein
MKHRLLTHTVLVPALAVATIGVLALTPAATADSPAPQTLNPAPPDFYTCTPLGAGTLCRAERQEVKVSEPQPELVCGSGAEAFVIHDNGRLDQRFTRWYDKDGNLTERTVHDYWSDTFWSNPLSGKTVPYHQGEVITTVLKVPGDFDSAVETMVGTNVMTDPVTHKKVLRSVGRTVYGPDGLISESGQQPFIQAFEFGDLSVFDDVCAALS